MGMDLILASDQNGLIEAIVHLYRAFQEFWTEYGQLGLFIYSIIETITPIAGVEVFFVTLVGSNPWWSVALVATIANAIGAFIVYFFMAKEDNKFYNKLLKKDQQKRAQRLFTRYGIWAIFIFSMTPLPFFIIIFTAAIARMKFTSYILAVIFSRGTRFFVTTFIMHYFSQVSTWMLVLILFAAALPLAGIMMIGQRKLLGHFESKAQEHEDKESVVHIDK